jgi:VCBS repeat-containing protein
VTITVAPVNDAPVAQAAGLTTQEDTAVNTQLTAAEQDGDTLSFSVVSAPTHGTASISSDGSCSYTPDSNFSGTDSFTFKVNDGTVDSAQATVTITVAPVNDAPVAQDSAVSVDAGSTVTDQLTATDPEDESLTFSIVSTPEHGSVTIGSGGTFSYTADNSDSETDSFSFKVSDGTADSNIGVVSITIIPADNPLHFEVGELQVSSELQTVQFTEQFSNPVVVAAVTGRNDAEPGIVRISNVTADGFAIRFQEWDYLDDIHPEETVTFMVMEEGHFTLDNGTQVEAGCFSASGASSFSTVSFAQAMAATPVIQTSITTVNEEDAVTSRVRNIAATGFEFMMREQESNDTAHNTETACYIAWEPSRGELSGIVYDVAVTGDVVTHSPYQASYTQSFTETPMLLASMQSTDGADTATTVISDSTAAAATVLIGEEQSRDSETNHITETVGYIAFGSYDLQADQDNDGLTTEEEVNTYHTDPNLADSDSDGLADGEEISYWQDRGIDWAGDLDDDGLSNILDKDADGDGMTDGAEIAAGLDPADPASVQTFPIMEAGEVDVDHNLIHVDLTRTFALPVVIARIVSKNDAAPCVVRIDSVTGTGFDLRLQEYEYLDNIHPVEQVAYIVMEAGHYTLADGTQLEAGSMTVRETSDYDRIGFSKQFSTAPVVIGTVAGVNDEDAVTARIRTIDQNGFDCKLQEEELTKTSHLPETVNYLAWEPSSGVDNGIRYEVATTGNSVTHAVTTVEFAGSFSQAPLVYTDMQTTDGGDSSTLRTLQVSSLDLQVTVEEEQSKDSEISHTSEDAGFIAILAE